jgi:chromosome segregation ATPase
MALRRVAIRNFQSLVEADLELGRFTVVVGPSSSGKSAFIRALRTLATNPRGSSFVTQGAKSASIGVDTEDGEVSWSRSGNSVTYRVNDEAYSKLNGDVPESVLGMLGITDPELHIAGQFDRPYLLSASAGEIARTLGALTNVSTILEAAREAARRGREVSGVLRTRRLDLERLKEELTEFVGFKERLAAQDEAEAVLARAKAVQAKLDRLSQLRGELERAETALAVAKSRLFDLPDATRARSLVETYQRLSGIKIDLKRLSVTAAKAGGEAEQLSLDIKNIEQERLDLLHELGTCPVCGSDTKELMHEVQS